MRNRTATGNPRLSRRKKVLFVLILALLLYGFIETTAYLSYRAVFHAGLPLMKSPGSKEEQDYALLQFFDEAQTKHARKQARNIYSSRKPDSTEPVPSWTESAFPSGEWADDIHTISSKLTPISAGIPSFQ